MYGHYSMLCSVVTRIGKEREVYVCTMSQQILYLHTKYDLIH